MKIDYQEPSKDLLMRIDIHEKYGSANIDVWTNDLLKPQPGMKILDVGCGAGKLSFLFNEYTKGAAQITGGDFSEDGKCIVLRTYFSVLLYNVENVADMAKVRATSLPVPLERQGEAICFDTANDRLITTSEGTPCRVSSITLP